MFRRAAVTTASSFSASNVQSGKRNFFSTLVPGSGNVQLSHLAGLGYGLGLRFWVVFTIIVSLTLTLTSFTTLAEILP